MLGHRFFHSGTLSLPEEPLKVRSSDRVAGVRCSSSGRSSSFRSSCASSGVCSVVLLECCDRADREERVDFCEAGRELGVRVEPHVASGVSITVQVEKNERNGQYQDVMRRGVLVMVREKVCKLEGSR